MVGRGKEEEKMEDGWKGGKGEDGGWLEGGGKGEGR